MKTRILWVLAFFCLFLGGGIANADHGGGGAGGKGIAQTILERLYPPQSSVYYSFEYNFLDNDLGYTILNEIRGEYAFKNSYSIGAFIPVWSARNDFIPANTRLGDVGLIFKAEAWESKTHRMNLFTGLNISFPTGNDQINLGAGAVAFYPYITYLKDWDRADVFVNVGGSFEASADVNPSVSYEAGVNIALVKGKVPVSFLVSYSGVTFISSDTFTSGSTKGWIVPGIMLELGEHWEMAFLGRISILDTLSFLQNVSAKNFTTGLYEDIFASAVFSLGYKF